MSPQTAEIDRGNLRDRNVIHCRIDSAQAQAVMYTLHGQFCKTPEETPR